MKFATAAAVLASAVAAAPLEPRVMIPIDVFNITDFQAHSIAHSSWSDLGFGVTVTTIEPTTSCNVSVLSYQRVGDAPETNCTEPTIAFNFTRTPVGGADFNIFWRLGEKGLLEGSFTIPPEDFVRGGLGTSVTEQYTGPTSFTISNLTLLHSVLGP
ncbi:hypothetical protein GQ53DRAFT_746188 [Thozetella sp. PMI_491]|nr:hypothetical protein GQ53DRAFT_746188 [Thozetella sp. PMI_491]